MMFTRIVKRRGPTVIRLAMKKEVKMHEQDDKRLMAIEARLGTKKKSSKVVVVDSTFDWDRLFI